VIFILSSLTFIYLILTGLLFYFWREIPELKIEPGHGEAFISVIIPVRNEEENISNLLRDIEAQNYPKNLLEVIIIDDDSTDLTVDVAQRCVVSFKLLIIPKKKSLFLSHKKAAITQGVQIASGNYIVTTDGDCRVPPNWISSIDQTYQKTDSKFISGLVTFSDERSLFGKIQTIEFASLIGTGAASINAGFPNMCNGANLSFEKLAFAEVGGYEGFENIQSGDDEFLMHKMHLAFPGKVSVLKDRSAIVTTTPKRTFVDFFHQRKRWAGKWPHYKLPSIKILALFIFLYNTALVAGVIYTIFYPSFYKVFLACFILKSLVDYLFLDNVLQFLGKNLKIKLFLITSIFYPFYVSFFAVCSNIGGYSWKGRNS